MKKSRRNFLKTIVVIISGLFLGSAKTINAISQKKSHLHDTVVQTMKLAMQERVNKLRELENEYGSDSVKQIVREYIKERAIKSWKERGEKSEKNDIDSFIKLLWEKNANNLEYSRKDEGNVIKMKCTKCSFHEKMKSIKATDWGFEFYCATDFYISEAFNPAIKFERTKTLMQGDDYCNHTYIVEAK